MQPLSHYISDLLFLHNCVIIPDLGGFVADYKSAVIDTDRNLVYPPSKTVVFNNMLRQNDGLLIHYIALKESLTYKAAQQWLEDYIKDLKHKLLTEGLVILDALGAFYLDEHHNFQFRVDLEENLLGDAYGLTNVSLPLNYRQTTTPPLHAVSIDQNQGIMKNKKALIRIAAVLGPAIAISAILHFGTDFFKTSQHSQTASFTVEEQKPTPTDSTEVKEIATQKKQALYYNENEKKSKYHIIAGSYTKIKNASVLKNQLNEQGNNAIILRENGKFRVSLQQFNDRYEALQKLDFLRKTTNQSYWLHKIEK